MPAGSEGEPVGHVLRRCQQLHHAVWAEEVGGILTSPQYSVVHSVAAARAEGTGPLDQHSLGVAAGLDRTTVAGVIRRLEAQGWLRRDRDPRDARRRVIVLPAPSGVALAGLAPSVLAVQERILAPVPAGTRDWLADRLAQLAPAGASVQDRRPGHLIRLAQQRHTALWAEELGDLLTGPQFAVLRVLAAQGPSPQSILAERAALDRSSTSEVLRRLEGRGWTGRRPEPGDRRTRLASLTGQGRDLLESVSGGVERVQRRILEPVPPGDRRRLVEVLAVVAQGA
ncbi:MarR family transcriptional regulator [Cellulosimicrobium funkei]|nr:MarR family transcriptional regulator [Cellulosimicrobium funkei]